MSKKNRTVQSVPEIYQGLTALPEHRNYCVIIDLEGNISSFANVQALESMKSYEELIKPSIQSRWNNFNEFVDKCNEQTALTHHANMFGAEPPAKQDLITTKLHTWHKLIANAKNTIVPPHPVNDTGRKSSILSCKYFAGAETGTGTLKTPQALASVRLFRQCMKELGTGEPAYITELTLRKYVEDHAGELRTRQDPWRIFQYYRPQLISAKILRRTMED